VSGQRGLSQGDACDLTSYIRGRAGSVVAVTTVPQQTLPLT